MAAVRETEGGVEKHLKGILRPVSQAIPLDDPATFLGVPDEASSKPTLLKGRLGSMSKVERIPKAYHPVTHR